MMIDIIKKVALKIYIEETKKNARDNLRDVQIILSEIQSKIKQNNR